MAVLLAHLPKRQHRPKLRGRSWQTTIFNQRKNTAIALKETPGLKAVMQDNDRRILAWASVVDQALRETGLDVDFGERCPQTNEEILSLEFLPVAV